MRLSEKAIVSFRALHALMFKRRTPLVVGWNVTYKCNLRCVYCASSSIRSSELDTDQSLSLIDEIADSGVKFIVLSGGEPLLRDDLGEIIDHCKDNRLHVSVNSNGTLAEEKFDMIRRVDEIQLSVDGPASVHDEIRGSGSHSKAIRAIDVCKNNGVHVNLSAVITKQDINDIDYLLDLADKKEVGVYFHPADRDLSGDSKMKIDVAPSVERFRNIIDYLMKQKASGRKAVQNSLSGLKHLKAWPEPKDIFCFVALTGCFIEPDGSVFVCDSFRNYRDYKVDPGYDFAETFDKLSLPHPCRRCWCGSTVDFNLLGSMKADTIAQLWRRFK